MRYFICASGGVCLAIPAERAERIIPVSRHQTVLCETEDQTCYISLPVLLREEDTSVLHGVVLKGGADPAIRSILLVSKIDVDLEIPEEEIHPLPGSFGGVYTYFRGVCFGSQGLILVLIPEKLLEVRSENKNTGRN